MKHAALRREIVETARRLDSTGLNRGTSGNVSARVRGGFLVTPSGVPSDEMAPIDVVEMGIDGKVVGPVSKTAPEPSTEWPFHAAIYAARPDAEAIVHAHSEAAMAVACLRRDVPAFHYMVAVAGGTSLRCARYATFGTAELARAAVEALEGRRACLLANHGQVAVHQTLRKALTLAIEVESLCATYLRALSAGTPVTLSETQMAEVTSKFSTYGRRPGRGARSRKARGRKP